MIAYLRGALFDFNDDALTIDVNGAGYEVFTHSRSFAALPAKGSDIFVYTFLQVLDNEFKLYGFLFKAELDLFKLLMGVSGIGARAALNILSVMEPDKFYYAIASGDEKSLTTIPGIGKKMAQRLCFELKEKIGKPLVQAGRDAGDNVIADVLEALEALGYSRSEVLPAVLELRDSGQLDNSNVEQTIKLVLKIKAAKMKR
ncbi:MAG TPA: Holliday junction branch migration protein RuvA [Syntrophomonadaceae bacterium]|nr:Holliday junction branch migration protein RuvA [Syntrophomonadaceae bacterium]